MKVEFIKKGIVVFSWTVKTNWEEVKDKFDEMKKGSTVKSLEMTFEDNTSLDDVDNIFMTQSSEKVLTQKVYLHD